MKTNQVFINANKVACFFEKIFGDWPSKEVFHQIKLKVGVTFPPSFEALHKY